MTTDITEQQAAAEAVRHELDLGHGLIDPFAVAERLGIEVVRFPSPANTLEGAYRPTDLGGYIYVNSGAAYVRQRFTMAHEIGHHRLHRDTTFLDHNIDAREDWQANRFAGALLIDPVGVVPVVERGLSVRAMVAEVSAAFWVSPSAAAITLKQLGHLNEKDLEAFMNEAWTYPSLLQTHGLTPQPDPAPPDPIPAAFRDRVVMLVERGQIDRDFAAELLETDSEAMPPEPAMPDPLGDGLLARDE